MSTAYPRPPVDEGNPLPKTKYATESFTLLALILVVGIFASTLPQPQALGKLPLQNLLKTSLHATREQSAGFFFLCGVFWYIKPLAGILTDAFPLFKTRRRYYLLFSSALAAVSWIGLGFVPRGYMTLLVAAIIVNLFMVMISTVAGAFLVEIGQSRGEVGKMTAVRQVTYNACSIIQGPLGGMFAMMSLGVAAGANALLVVSIFPVAYFLMREKPNVAMNPHALRNASQQLGVMGRSGSFWISIAFLGLFYFAPGFSTMQYYRQSDVLKLTPQTIGWLQAIGGVGGVLASLAYAFLARRIALRTALVFGIITAGAGTLFYLYYNSLQVAYAIDFQNGLFFGFAECALIDLAARGTPAGCEGLGYSLMMSMRNLAVFGADWLGSHIADTYHVQWGTMVIVNAVSTAVVLILLPFMPRRIMSSRDNMKPNLENTGEPAPEAA